MPRLRQIKQQAYAAAVEARQRLAQAEALMKKADAALDQVQSLLCKIECSVLRTEVHIAETLAAWTEVAEEILDGGSICLDVDDLNAKALINLLSGKGAQPRIGIKWELLEGDEAPKVDA